MHINLYATFRLLAGVKSLEIDMPGEPTVSQIVNQVVARLPVLRSHWLDENGEVHAHVHIFVNGEDVQNMPMGLQTHLQPGSTVDFLPPVGGG